ncbi:hypothetical protein ACT453_33545, partial [Bacillus sp. D-CC]
FMPIRVATTGQTHGPELPNAIALLAAGSCSKTTSISSRSLLNIDVPSPLWAAFSSELTPYLSP